MCLPVVACNLQVFSDRLLVIAGEVWNNLTLELAPDGKGGASIVWSWCVFPT